MSNLNPSNPSNLLNPSNLPVWDIIPQRAPMLMVDRLLSYDPAASESELLIRPDNIFLSDVLQTAGIVEHIAQTCAARIGYYNKYILHRPVVIGYIAAIRRLDVHRQPEAGEELLTQIEELGSAFGMTLVRAEVRTSLGELIADGELKIALSES